MSKFRQAMPPPGGYKPFPFLRMPTKPKISGVIFVTAVAIESIIATAWLYVRRKNYANQLRENEEAEVALQPFIEAEREREVLKQLWLNREEENELMKDVPGWVTGTWYGEKVFRKPVDVWMPLSIIDMYAHCDKKYMFKRQTYPVRHL